MVPVSAVTRQVETLSCLAGLSSKNTSQLAPDQRTGRHIVCLFQDLGRLPSEKPLVKSAHPYLNTGAARSTVTTSQLTTGTFLFDIIAPAFEFLRPSFDVVRTTAAASLGTDFQTIHLIPLPRDPSLSVSSRCDRAHGPYLVRLNH